MSGMISRQIKDQIIDQTNIVEVVSEVVQLTKKGSSYFGLCPFHDDNHPSMSVNREKKIFNCFSCHTKGNVIHFFALYHHLTEDQATIQLAKRLGITISENQSKEEIIKERLIKVTTEAKNFYHFYLKNSNEGLVAKEYLQKRGIDQNMIDQLGIGLASDAKDYLHQALNAKNCSELDQIEVGLVKLNEKNSAYDVFRERIIFPITNMSGQVVGFSGRIYKKSDQAKYINSPETTIFHKGQILYHFYEALDAIKKNDKIIILEGFMDVIACIKAGIQYGVATMGTALTKEHIKSILKITKQITLCFDGDEAGIMAMKRACSLLADFNVMPKAIVLPNNLDPDEYQMSYGSENLIQYFHDNEKSAYEWLYDLALKRFVKGDLESGEQFKKEVFASITIAKQHTVIDHFLNKLSVDLGVSFESLKSDFQKNTYLQSPVEYADQTINTIQTETITRIKKKQIKKKVYIAYRIIIRHLLDSKLKLLEFNDKFGSTLYLDSSLVTYFEIIKKMGIFYADNDEMDQEDFLTICQNLDKANGSEVYVKLAEDILANPLVNTKDSLEFEQCLKAIEQCVNELSQTKLYNRAIDSKTDEDIQNFESLRKENVKIVSKEG